MQKGVQLIQKWHCPKLFCVLNVGYTQQLQQLALVHVRAQSGLWFQHWESHRRGLAWSKQAEIHLELQNTLPVNRSPRLSCFAGAQRQLVILSTYKPWKTSNCVSSQPQISCISLDCFVLFVHFNIRKMRRSWDTSSQHTVVVTILLWNSNVWEPPYVKVKCHKTEYENFKQGLNKNYSAHTFFFYFILKPRGFRH